MTVIKAAYQVLREAGKPLHYDEITDRILSTGLWQTRGKTPSATVNATISADIKHNPNSRFRRTSAGVYAVASGPNKVIKGKSQVTKKEQRSNTRQQTYKHPAAGAEPATTMSLLGPAREARERRDDLPAWIEEHNRRARAELLDRARKGSPAEFEDLVGQLLRKMGFEEVEVTPLGGDGGVDVRGDLVVGDVVRIRMAVQAKRWKANVPAPVIQQVRGSLGAHEQGLIITTSDFSAGARREAARSDASPVALMNGRKLADLLAEYEVGAVRKSYVLVLPDD